jgi:hypothetical protein
MSHLSEVFEVIESLKSEGIILDYAVAGAMAVLFYTEPLRTYDLDIFVFLPGEPGSLVTLGPLHRQLVERGYRPDAEHVLIHGLPVQFLPAYNDLASEALREAVVKEYEPPVHVRVLRPEHLAALAVQTGGRKRREHVARLLESPEFDMTRFEAILNRHGLMDEWRSKWSDS